MEGDFIGGDFDEFDPLQVERLAHTVEEDIKQEEDKTLSYLRRRKQAYARVFTPGERTKEDIDIVLADLMWFCRVTKPTFDPRDGANADTLSRIKEGRREAFMRIREFSALDFDALILMYTDATTKGE